MLDDVRSPALIRFGQGRKNLECSRNSENFAKAGLELHMLPRRNTPAFGSSMHIQMQRQPPPPPKYVCVETYQNFKTQEKEMEKCQTLLPQLNMSLKT